MSAASARLYTGRQRAPHANDHAIVSDPQALFTSTLGSVPQPLARRWATPAGRVRLLLPWYRLPDLVRGMLGEGSARQSNATRQPRPEAGAERTLEGVACTPLLGMG